MTHASPQDPWVEPPPPGGPPWPAPHDFETEGFCRTCGVHVFDAAGPCQGPPASERSIALIRAERARQITVEGYTAEHDTEHDRGQLALAAAAYALAASGRAPQGSVWWPFHGGYKPGPEPLASLVKAAALIVAEMDRLTGGAP
jgi:hypothetical protein